MKVPNIRNSLLAAFALAAAATVAFGLSYLVHDPSAAEVVVNRVGPVPMILFTALFMLLGSKGIPPVLFVLMAAYLWPFPQAFAVSLAGSLGAAAGGYWISRYSAGKLMQPSFLSGLRRYRYKLADHELKTIVLLRLLFYLFPPVTWMLGLTRVKFSNFMLGTLIGSLPGTLLFSLSGQTLLSWMMKHPVLMAGFLLTLGAGVYASITGGAAKMKTNRTPEAVSSEHQVSGGKPKGLFFDSLRRYSSLCLQALFRSDIPGKGPGPKRLLMMALFMPVFGFIQGINWFFLKLDDLLFPRYKKIEIRRPLFIVGVPRSGTTFLHRVLARDPGRYTTFTLWELLFAPSIIQRRMILFFAHIDRIVGRPLFKLMTLIQKPLTGAVGKIHGLALTEPEEDFVALTPVLACFLLVVPFPFAGEIRDLAYFDERVPQHRRGQIMEFYRSLLQRHMYHHGTDLAFLSKNVSFTPMIGSLMQSFPDCRIIMCTRDPLEAVPSQISSMKPAWKFFGGNFEDPSYPRIWMDLMHHYYERIKETAACKPIDNVQLVTMDKIQFSLENTITRIYEAVGQPLTPEFEAILVEEGDLSRKRRSRHRYNLDEYGLSPEMVRDHYRDVFITGKPFENSGCRKTGSSEDGSRQTF